MSGKAVLDRDPADRVRQGQQVPLPGLGESGVDLVGQAGHQVGHDTFEEVLPSAHVAVEGHGAHPELLAQGPHRQSLETMRVDVAQGRLDDQVPAERRPPGATGLLIRTRQGTLLRLVTVMFYYHRVPLPTQPPRFDSWHPQPVLHGTVSAVRPIRSLFPAPRLHV